MRLPKPFVAKTGFVSGLYKSCLLSLMASCFSLAHGIDSVSQRYIVELGSRVAPFSVIEDYGLTAKHVYRHSMVGFSAEIPPDVQAKLIRDSRVLSVVDDRPIIMPASKCQESSCSGLTTFFKADTPKLVRTHQFSPGNVDCLSPSHQPSPAKAKVTASKQKPEVTVWSVRILDGDGFGTWSSVLCGVDFVASKNGFIHAANLNYTGKSPTQECQGSAIDIAFCNAENRGMLFVMTDVQTNESLNHKSDQIALNQLQTDKISAIADVADDIKE